VKSPAVVSIFLGLRTFESRGIARSGPFRVRSILQQVTPKIVLELTESVSFEGVCSLRAGEGEGPPTRWPGVGRLVGSHIRRTAEALMGGSGEKIVLVWVGWRRGFISCPCCAKHKIISG
jgi:hypothetical protein